MTLPTPPRYVVLMQSVIEQAYGPDKPRRALLASFIRILSLAWETKYKTTPELDEEELMDYLKLSRRQYFEQKADMELLGWLRSSHPRPGFVRFSFSQKAIEAAASAEEPVSAENRTGSAENRTIESMIEDESIKQNTNESSSIKAAPVRKIAPMEMSDDERKTKLLVDNLSLLFEPRRHGKLNWRDTFLVGVPECLIGWIAKAYQDRERLNLPLGFIVKHLTQNDVPDAYYTDNYMQILPASYLAAIGAINADMSVDIASGDDCTVVLVGDAKRELWWNNWKKVIDLLKLQVPHNTFQYVKETEAIRYDGNTLVVGAKNAHLRDWLESRMQSTVERLLVGIFNQDVQVQFVVMEDALEDA